MELETQADGIDREFIPVNFIPGLLECERSVFNGLLKSRRPFIAPFEKRLVGFVDALNNVLNGLTAKLPPFGIIFSKSGDMSRQPGRAQILSKHTIIALVQSDAMIINPGGDTPEFIQLSPSAGFINLVFIRLFHSIKCTNLFF